MPKQKSVTGFDGLGASTWLSYQLTTLRQPLQHMALASVKMLGGLIGQNGAGPEMAVFLPPRSRARPPASALLREHNGI